MAEEIGSLVVRISADVSNMENGLRNMQEKANSFGDNLKKLGGVIAGAFAVEKVVDFFKSTIEDAGKAQETMTQLGAVLKSTGGVAGVTSESAVKLAEGLSDVTKYSKGSVIGAENMLLTFTNIGKGVFPQATTAVLNMSTALGQDLKSSSIQLGKALQDPVAGVTALQRVGVKLSDAQKEQVKSFMAVGDTASAQKVILKELDTEFGNSAVAAGTTFPGKLAILNNKFEEVKKSIGEKLIPVLSNLAGWFIEKMPAIQSIVGNSLTAIGNFMTPIYQTILPLLQQSFKYFTDNILPLFNGGISETTGNALPSFSSAISNIVNNILPPLRHIFEVFINDVLPKLVDAYMSWIKGVYPILVEAFNYIVANVLPPLIKIFEFIATEIVPKLAAAFKEWVPIIVDIMKNLWSEIKVVLDFIVAAFNYAWPFIKEVVRIAADTIGGIITGTLKTLKGITDFVSGVFTGNWKKAWGGIKEIFSGVWDSIKAIGKGAVNGIIDLLNDAIRALNGLDITVPDWVPKIGGDKFSLGIPEIPKLATGTNFVPFDTAAFIHKGEAVIPAKNNPSNPSASNPIGGNISFAGAIFNVRSDNDAKMIAREIYNLQMARSRSRGVIAPT